MNAVKANVAKAATVVVVVARLSTISVRRKMGRENLFEKFLLKYIRRTK